MLKTTGCGVTGFKAIRFEYAYDALIRVLARKTPTAGRPQPPVYVTPPGQTTVPANPNFSDSTTCTASSGSSESKPEHYSDLFANMLMKQNSKLFNASPRTFLGSILILDSIYP